MASIFDSGSYSDYRISVVKAKRRTLAMRVLPNGTLEVRAPLRSSDEIIEKFLLENESWISKRIAEQRQRLADTPPHVFAPGEEFWFLGQRYQLEITDENSKPLALQDKFLLHSASKYRAATLFEKWYREEAKIYINDRVKYFKTQLEVNPKAVRITGAATRWGSCSPEGNINFCWRLIMAPPVIIDYVVIHELAHIRHADHSKSFWNLVATLDPAWKTHRQWLHKEGHKLTV